MRAVKKAGARVRARTAQRDIRESMPPSRRVAASTKDRRKGMPLSRLVTVPPKAYSSANLRHDDITMIGNYLPGASTLDIVERLSAGLSGTRSGRMLSITGPYGSGKSTMAVFLKGLLAPKASDEWRMASSVLEKESADAARGFVAARKKTSTIRTGLITCATTAAREPIAATVLRALDDGARKYFGRYGKRDFDGADILKRYIKNPGEIPSAATIVRMIASMCDVAPVALIIDEFGKNIEYFAADEGEEGDLFLLQELAEMSGPGRKVPLFVITLQHMAFDDYAVGAPHARRQEWSKIQGRFEDIPFANSPNQTRQLVSSTIQLDKKETNRRIVRTWAGDRAAKLKSAGVSGSFDPDLVASCYPLDPLSLEVLPELCSRYGQYERTLLSFLSDGGRNTVATFIDEHTWSGPELPSLGLDVLYDYFIRGTGAAHSSSADISRLMEIETVIRDSHGLDRLEAGVLKTIGVLNLIGRSGRLRASQKMVEYAAGREARRALKRLQDRSIITYREHADEYRVWHGTDIDIAAKLDAYRKQYQKAPLAYILERTVELKPTIVVKHSMDFDTMRLFERRFAAGGRIMLGDEYDGAILYQTDGASGPKCDRPIVTAVPGDTTDMRQAAIEVMAIREILGSNKDVVSDWVARRELEERLADAEVVLESAFVEAFGKSSSWSYNGRRQTGTPAAIASQVCDKVYDKTPVIHNEMINRNEPSTQGSAAKRLLLEKMIANTSQQIFGIEGFGPERAIYEAVFAKNNIHVLNSKFGWQLSSPSKDNTLYPIWQAILGKLQKSKSRVQLLDMYKMCKDPPFGGKTGTIDIFMTVILLMYRDNIAIYEHGSYSPRLSIEIVERMMKNPAHFELKYFKSIPVRTKLINTLAKDLKITSEGSILNIVSHLARAISGMTPYVRQTKNLDKTSIAVRDTVASAREPDTLLFNSLPEALGFKAFGTNTPASDISKFSKILAKAMAELERKFQSTIDEIQGLLFASTGMNSRKKLSIAASKMLKSVDNPQMKAFLTALSTDTLERDADWISYVTLSLTDIPLPSWKDGDYEMFRNSLVLAGGRFKRLAGVHFADISEGFPGQSYQVTVTRADGAEYNDVASLRPAQRKAIKAVEKAVMREMKKQGFGEADIPALIAHLISETAED